MSRTLILAAFALLASAADVSSQVILGVDNTVGVTFEFTAAPGGPCFAPNSSITSCAYGPPICPGMAPLVPLGFGTLLGDIADDPVTDRTYVTDGRVVVEYSGDPACGGPCTPIKDWFVPLTAALGPVTGMGCSGSGTFGPGPRIWFTDGTFVWGVTPPTGCGPAVISVPPCPLPAALVPATDLSWDSSAGGRLWVSSAAGFVQAITVPGCAPASPLSAVTACGLGPLTGLAYDTSTPNGFGQPPSAFVTDGAVVAYINVLTGAAAPPTFHAPVTCTPAPGFLSGLALANRGVEFGAPRVTAHLTSFGQSTSPGPTFGLELSGQPPAANAWRILNYNFPGPGFFCPALAGLSTKIYVDPTAPGLVNNLGPLGPGCIPMPLPIPAAVPIGLRVFVQFVFLPPGGPPAVDASNGLAFTIGRP